MFKAALIASLAASVVAFRPTSSSRSSMHKVSMTAKNLPGIAGPLGYFDPLGNYPCNLSSKFDYAAIAFASKEQ